jgi:transcriptional regulator with XRE-family HTH domain
MRTHWVQPVGEEQAQNSGERLHSMNDQTLQAVAARLTAARKMRKMTQQDVADAAGVSLGAINNLENARTMPQRKTRAAIAQALGEDIFEDGLADAARLGWPDDVQVFTEVIGGYLAGLTPAARAEVVGRWMREITGQAT